MDKDLLLKDLCGRLPYGVKCKIKGEEGSFKIKSFLQSNSVYAFDFYVKENMSLSFKMLDEFKPYLFPLSSMTEEQKEEYNSECKKDLKTLSEAVLNRTYTKTRIETPLYYGIDWLNANHFDYRDLIPKGLALDATGLNIY